MSKWTTILSKDELDAHWELVKKLDPKFAKSSRKYYETRELSELMADMHKAWLCNDGDWYQLARSYEFLQRIGEV
jgi:hypothetical protein